MFSREDWTLFRNINTLSQKAGVPVKDMRALVLKEIMDNALDAAPGKKPEYGDDGTAYWIQDHGPGIGGGAEALAHLFSIRRPLTSTKILRQPSRGALGNGIRVIVGALLASGGTLVVHTRGHRYPINLFDDGTTSITGSAVTASAVQGTRVEVTFGSSLPRGQDDWKWARVAAAMSFAKTYQGHSNPWWYDSDSFFELLMASDGRTLTEMLKLFGFRAGALIQVRDGANLNLGLFANKLTREQADDLLGIMRKIVEPVKASKIGRLFATKESAEGSGMGYSKKEGTIVIQPGRGRFSAEIPFVVESLATKAPYDTDILIPLVNGTSITGDIEVRRYDDTGKVALMGCGLNHYFERLSKVKFKLIVNVTIPYMPITTDGKAPDFRRIMTEMNSSMTGATRKLKASVAKIGGVSRQTDVLERYVEQAIAKASGDGEYRFSLRQLYYALRPYVLEKAENGELDYGYFSRWVGQYENENGEIRGMYRDPRGTLYHPHTGETIPIGTIAVEGYKRPEWTFNKVLYIEKEGLFEVLKQQGFPEKYDCALLSSKGFASRAVRDLLDLLGDTGEEIHMFAIHDADGPGTSIYESLVEGTLARGARRVKVHNLGLEPWEGVEMGLQVETFERRKQKTVVARYVKDTYEEKGGKDGYEWERWLQENRIELNAMTSPQFVSWLEGKFDDIEAKKIVPPVRVMEQKLRAAAEAQVRAAIRDEILAKAGFESKVALRMDDLDNRLADADLLKLTVQDSLRDEPTQHWTAPVEKLAAEIAKGA